MAALLLGMFACAALALLSFGVYAALDYLVTQRTREIGIRVAVGAQVGDLIREMLGQGAKLAVVELAAGVAAVAALSRLVRGLLYEISPYDGAVFLCAPLFLLIIVLLASLFPAKRAAKVDPLLALRFE